MPDNKLFKLFNSLNGKEKRACRKLLKSPFFNQKEELCQLWEWLIVLKRDKKKGMTTPEEGWNWVFPEQAYKAAQWRHLQSQLVQLIDKMLIQGYIQSKQFQTDLYLAPIYRQKNLDLKPIFKRAEDRLARLPKDSEFYHKQYQLDWEKYAAIESTERVGKKNLARINESLDTYLISSKLRLACLMESHRAVSNVDYKDPLLGILLPYVQEATLLNIPAVNLYYYCYMSLLSGTESDFRSFRRTLKEQQQEIPAEERTIFLKLAINYCIKQLNAGEIRYVQEALDLYQTGLDTEVLLNEGQLSRFAYKNIVALALKLNKFDWVETFIHDYAALLKNSYRDSNRNYNLARLYFVKKEYHKAMPLLAQVDDSDLLLNLDSRVMLLKMYYEMEQFDSLDSLISSFQVLLLRKKKVIGYHQQHYLNLLRYLKKMIRLNPYDKAAVARFRNEVEQSAGVMERKWILGVVGGWG